MRNLLTEIKPENSDKKNFSQTIISLNQSKSKHQKKKHNKKSSYGITQQCHFVPIY